MGKYTTVLFDFDGTVMDTNNVIIQSWQHTFRRIEGREHSVDEIVRTFGEPLEITMARMFPEHSTEETIEIYRSYHRDHFEKLISVFPGMKELLDELSRRKFRMGLVTSRLTHTTFQGLRAFDLEPYFDCIVTADDCTRHKPDPQPVQKALEKLGSKPTEAVMLGDSLFDIRCAHNAGADAILVGWALAVGQEELTGIDRPEYRIERAEDLLGIL